MANPIAGGKEDHLGDCPEEMPAELLEIDIAVRPTSKANRQTESIDRREERALGAKLERWFRERLAQHQVRQFAAPKYLSN